MLSTKLKKILFKLSNLYFPFSYLSPERLQEIVNHIRIIELQQDEILQIRGSKSQDYLYLLEGEIDVVCEGNIQTIADPLVTQRNPLQLAAGKKSCSIIARQDCIIGHANRDILDTIIAWDHIGREPKPSVKHLDIVRNTLVFRRLPIEYIESAFSRMKRQKLPPGHTIRDNRCDAYYLIISGSAEAQRFNQQTQQYQGIATLGAGDIFGDEIMVASKTPAEIITMLEETEVLVLGKNDYEELMNRPLVKTVHARVAQTMLDNGYQLLDVRFAEEYAENRIPGAKLIPLHELSSRLNELNRKQPYIVYCHSGPRSAIAALILSENRIEALSLEGGIRDWPFDIEHPSAKSQLVPGNKKFH
jgi:rhodanese-related sulfurtransferase